MDTWGNTVLVHPDLERVPSGGYDPTSNPPGAQTRSADPTLYFGQLDTVTRVSRVHTIWFPAGGAAPDHQPPILEPAPAAQPPGTEIVVEYRGASGFVATNGGEYDADSLDPYGDLRMGSAVFWGGDGEWTENINDLDGAPFVQLRITFVANTSTGRVAELSTLALAFAL